MNTKILGERGEKIAAKYLMDRGYQLIARNVRMRSGEIDLVALHNGCLCFVEVKSRRGYDAPQEAVSYIKQRKLTQLAQGYLKKYYGSRDVRCRFDVIAVEETVDGNISLQLFENAFDAVF